MNLTQGQTGVGTIGLANKVEQPVYKVGDILEFVKDTYGGMYLKFPNVKSQDGTQLIKVEIKEIKTAKVIYE